MNSTTCGRCNRPLTSEKSCLLGYGPRCWKKIKQTKVDVKPEQVDKARELIEDGGVVHLKSQVFHTVSTDGTETYLTAPTNCTCKAGLNGRTCFHMAAVRMMLAA